MSKYKEIKGFKVQTLNADPVSNIGAWASGANLNTARKGLSGFGTQTAAIAATGNAPSTVTSVESWDGSSWTEVTDVNTGKFYRGNTGTQTAGLLIGGAPATTDTEEYDGSSWTETANYPVSITAPILLGVQTAAFCVGGQGTGPRLATTNTYNGSSFTGSTAINTARVSGVGAGSTTAAVITGGSTPSVTANTELWNGSAWTEVNNLNTARDLLAGSGSSSTNFLAFGGSNNPTPFFAVTESWDGTSWTEVADLATAKSALGGSTNGSNTLALAFGGATAPGAVQNATEIWTNYEGDTSQTHQNLGQVYYNSGSNAFKVTKTVYGTGAWASGGAMNTARAQVAGAGSQGAGIVVGGTGPPPGSQNAELYNGSAWTETGNLSGIARRLQAGTGGGSQSSAISVGGYSAPPSPNGTLNLVEKWDGSSWSEVSEINTARYHAMGAGASNQSAMTAGGETAASGETANTEVWDNSSWTETGNLSSARTQCAGGGPVTSAMSVSQSGSPKGIVSTFNGSTWSDVTELNTDRQAVMAMINNDTAGTVAGGTGPASPNSALTETWNGTAWTEVADLASGRYNGTGVGVSTEGFVAGGGTSASGTTTTEEWTVPATATNTTITVG